jgi:hypothetical protein
MEPTLAIRLEHAFIPGRDAGAAAAVAEILTRPCFADLRRVALETAKGRVMRHSATSRERVQALMQDPACDMVWMDSGRREELVATARIETGLLLDAGYWDAFPAPLMSTVVVPHDASLTGARLAAFCELAVALRAMAGCTSVEMDYDMASRLINGQTPPPRKGLVQPGMTLRRLQERRSYDQRTSDRQVPSPEWGLFLSRGHLEQVPASELEASGVFHQVRRLSDDLVFLQRTADPADALRPDFDGLLDPSAQGARAGLVAAQGGRGHVTAAGVVAAPGGARTWLPSNGAARRGSRPVGETEATSPQPARRPSRARLACGTMRRGPHSGSGSSRTDTMRRHGPHTVDRSLPGPDRGAHRRPERAHQRRRRARPVAADARAATGVRWQRGHVLDSAVDLVRLVGRGAAHPGRGRPVARGPTGSSGPPGGRIVLQHDARTRLP